MTDIKRNIRRILERALDESDFHEMLRKELDGKVASVEALFIAEGTRFATVFLKPNIGPIMVEGVGWSKPLD